MTLRRGGPILCALAAPALLAGCGDSAPAEGGPLNVARTFGEPGTFPGQFAYARAIEAYEDDDGRELLVVVDKAARMQILDAETGDCLAGWKTPEWELGKPVGLHVGPHPTIRGERALWVGDTHYHRILVYELPEIPDSAGRIEFNPKDPLLTFGSFGTEPGQYVYVTDVAVLPATDPDAPSPVERVYVGEYGGNDRITILEPALTQEGQATFEAVSTFGIFGTGDVEGEIHFNRPQSIEVDAARRELVVTDSGNHRVGRFTLDGEPIAWIAGPDRMHYPYGLQLVGDTGALVCEFGGCRVHHIDLESGETLGIYGEPGRSLGQLNSPWGVAVLGREAFVLDSASDRVIAFRSPAKPRDPVITAIGGAR
ncbi:MAG: hypothetical protein AAGI17_07450 [Planctomycetota bacterium]